MNENSLEPTLFEDDFLTDAVACPIDQSEVEEGACAVCQ